MKVLIDVCGNSIYFNSNLITCSKHAYGVEFIVNGDKSFDTLEEAIMFCEYGFVGGE